MGHRDRPLVLPTRDVQACDNYCSEQMTEQCDPYRTRCGLCGISEDSERGIDWRCAEPPSIDSQVPRVVATEQMRFPRAFRDCVGEAARRGSVGHANAGSDIPVPAILFGWKGSVWLSLSRLAETSLSTRHWYAPSSALRQLQTGHACGASREIIGLLFR